MAPKQITRQGIFRVMIAGFALVILLLAAAAVVGIRNIRDIQSTARDLLRDQSVSRRLIDDLQKQQTSLSEVLAFWRATPIRSTTATS
jgi:hypothetical protein